MRRRIFRNMFFLSFTMILISTTLMAVLAYRETYDSMKTDLRSEAEYIAAALELSGPDYLKTPVRPENRRRVTLVAPSGEVLFDSEEKAEVMENHLERPEIRQAAREGRGESARQSHTIGKSSYYYAVRLSGGGYLRMAGTTNSVYATLASAVFPMLALVAVMLLLAALAARSLMRQILKPLNSLNLEEPLSNEAYEELSPLLGRIERQNEIIRRQLTEMSKTQDEFAAITENMNEGLIVLSAKAVILSTNAGALRIFGNTAEAVHGRHILNLYRGPELTAAVENALAGEYGRAEFTLGGRQYQAQASPVLQDSGVGGAVLLIFDVTERYAAERLRREFSANVSHELKTPLTSISGYAEIIRDGLVRGGDIPDFAGRIYAEAARMIALVDDIIKISRLDEQNVQIAKEPVDLLALARAARKSLEGQIARKHLTFEVSGEPVPVSGMKSILEELLYNLCENAVKYNRVGGRVDVILARAGQGAALTVRDTGIGIPAEHQERVFERFYRVDKSHSRDTGGTGLGLSIVKHAAAAHGAEIRLQSAPGKGTEITVTFPGNKS